MKKITISITDEHYKALELLARTPAVPEGTPEEVLEHLIGSMAAGVRRRGSWERGCVQQLFGYEG
jgi:hypothetical protein